MNFNANPVIRMIANQKKAAGAYLITKGGMAHDELKMIFEAMEDFDRQSNGALIASIFELGYIYGKKAERARRTHRPITPIYTGVDDEPAADRKQDASAQAESTDLITQRRLEREAVRAMTAAYWSADQIAEATGIPIDRVMRLQRRRGNRL